MDELVCNVCFDHYDKHYTLPKVLKCGDTICSNCVCSTFECPKCGGSLTSQNSDDYIVNFAILRIVDSLKDGTTGSAFLQHCIVTLKKKYADIESKFKKKSEKLKSDLKDILLCIHELNEDGEANQTILTINKQLDEIRRSSSVFGLQSSRFSESINLCNFMDPVTYLCEIYNRAADGELIYATTKVEEVVKFSRISVWSSKLILHAFDSLQNDCTSRTICKFQEIKKCLTDENCCAFLEVCSNERGKRHCLLIQTTNSSLVPQFLKFCTGEKGPVYKGASFQRGVDAVTLKFVFKDFPFGTKDTETSEKNDLCAFNKTPIVSSLGNSLFTKEDLKAKEDLKWSTAVSKFRTSLLNTDNCQPLKSQLTPVSSQPLTTASTFGGQLSTSNSCEHKTLTSASLDEDPPFPSSNTADSHSSENLPFKLDHSKSTTNFKKVNNKITSKSVFMVKKFKHNGIEDEGNFEYVSSLGSKSTYKSSDTFVTGAINGSFQIFRALGDGYAHDVIGTIHEPHKFLDNITYSDYSKITDSGIAIEIP